MSAARERLCGFVGADGTPCGYPLDGDNRLCYWHDPEIAKDDAQVRARLEEWVGKGGSMEGFELARASLEGVRLNNAQGCTMRCANLYRANLQGASLFNADLRGACLLKADFTGANLNHANLQGADLLGAIFEDCKVERVDWGERAMQEERAYEAEGAGRLQAAGQLFQEAEEIYLNLRRVYDAAGRFDQAGRFFHKEMTMRRHLMPRWSAERVWSKLVDMICGYGESPERVIGFSLSVILGSAVLYFFIGVKDVGGYLQLDPDASFLQNFSYFLNCIYYSIVTFTTLGYGDITPIGFARPVAALEAFTGAFMMALFVAVFGKKMTRG